MEVDAGNAAPAAVSIVDDGKMDLTSLARERERAVHCVLPLPQDGRVGGVGHARCMWYRSQAPIGGREEFGRPQ